MLTSIICLLLLCLLSAPTYAANTHDLGSQQREMQAWFDDRLSPYVTTGCTPAVPAGLALAAFACEVYVRDASTGEQIYVTENAAVTIADATPTWLAVHRDRSTTLSGWTRQSATHYLFRQNATRPADPAGGMVFAKVTVAGSVITAIETVGTYVFSDTETLAAATTFGVDTSLILTPGGTIDHDTNALTINGQMSVFPLMRQIVTGTGTLTFGNRSVSTVYPEWCGAITGDATVGAANQTAFAKCATGSGAMHVRLSAGTYTITGGIALTIANNQQQKWTGAGDVTVLDETGTGVAFGITDAAGVTLEDFAINGGSGANAHGFELHSSTNNAGDFVARKIIVTNSGGYGFRIRGGQNIRFFEVEGNNNGNSGFYCEGGSGAFTSATLVDVFGGQFSSNANHGVEIGSTTSSNDCNEVLMSAVAVENNTSNGFKLRVGKFTCVDCRPEGNGGDGFDVETTGALFTFINSVSQVASGSGHNFDIQGGTVTLINPDASENLGSGNGIDIDSNSTNVVIINPQLGAEEIVDPGNDVTCFGVGCVFSDTSSARVDYATTTEFQYGNSGTATTEIVLNVQSVAAATTIVSNCQDEGTKVTCKGQDVSTTANRWYDELVCANAITSPITADVSATLSGSPGARTWTRSTNALQLAIGSAQTHDVTCWTRVMPSPLTP